MAETQILAVRALSTIPATIGTAVREVDGGRVTGPATGARTH
jgi:hypothetical protein